MGRFDGLSGVYGEAVQPLTMFEDFLDSGMGSTHFFKSSREFRCTLDFLYVWLVEGNGALACPTFESWLLTIIAFAGEMRMPDLPRIHTKGGTNSIGYRCNGDELDLLYWGEHARDEQYFETLQDLESLGGPDANVENTYRAADEEGMNHPALNKAVYERCREFYLRRQARM